jgi:hypothetical protein
MSLQIDGERHRITHLAADYVTLASPFPCAPTDGEILLTIDGVEDRWAVHLPAGIDTLSTRIPISSATNPSRCAFGEPVDVVSEVATPLHYVPIE